MPRGRKPKPTMLKVIDGSRQPIKGNEPRPDVNFPAPPPELTDSAKVEWGRAGDELYRLGLLSNIDRAAFAAYCQAYGTWIDATKTLAKMAENDPVTGGLLIRTSNGNPIQNPIIGVINRSRADVMRFAAEFGMTPSARTRIDTGRRDQSASNPFANNGRGFRSA